MELYDFRFRKRHNIFCPNGSTIYFDEACLIVENVLNDTLELRRITDACYKCTPQFWTQVGPLQSLYLTVPISVLTTFYYTPSRAADINSCWVTYEFQQHGLYKYTLDLSCDDVEVMKQHSYSYTSLLAFTLIVLILWIVQMCLSHLSLGRRLRRLLRRELERDTELETIYCSESVSEPKKVVYDEAIGSEHIIKYESKGTMTGSSLGELDDLFSMQPESLEFVEFEALLAFRGLTVTMWVYLNVEGRTYSFLQNSSWDGLRLSDIPLAWFYWALAASFYLHFYVSLSRGESRTRVLLRGVLLRTVLYCAAGLCYNHINNTSTGGRDVQSEIPSIADFRVFGILQRVGLAQLITSAVEVCVMARTVTRGPLLQDLKDSWPQWIVCSVLVAVHSCVTYLLPSPGCPTGYIGPGGLHDNSSAVHCTGGAARLIDQQILTNRHMPPAETLRETWTVYRIHEPFDPQGLLGTSTTCFLMALAMQASRIFVYFHHPLSRAIRLVFWAIVQLLLAGVLCNFRQYDGPVPINHYLMSVSYVLATSGLAYLALLGLYLLVSVWRWWSGVPFIYSGANILVVFAGSKLFNHTFPFVWEIPQENMYTHSEFLLMAFWSVCVWSFVSYQLLRRGLVCPV